jgi:hypothetical protein
MSFFMVLGVQERKVWVEDPAHPDGGSWQYDYAITNVEYTEFERLGITDQPKDEGSNHSAFPANTNILYVGLAAARAAVESAIAAGGEEVLPGLIFNLKKKVKTTASCICGNRSWQTALLIWVAVGFSQQHATFAVILEASEDDFISI